jgi:hypothetical protein
MILEANRNRPKNKLPKNRPLRTFHFNQNIARGGIPEITKRIRMQNGTIRPPTLNSQPWLKKHKLRVKYTTMYSKKSSSEHQTLLSIQTL